MASHPHVLNSALSLEDRNHDVTGWDAAGRGGEASWYPPLTAPARRQHSVRAWCHVSTVFWITLGTLITLATGAVMLVPPVCVTSKIATNETAAIQNLKALATAQAQFHKRMDAYAGGGWALNANGTLIAADLKNAFEDFQNNGDATTPQPKAGYRFRLLQSDRGEDPVAWRNDVLDSAAGMIHWAVICRAADPGISGENQYLIGEDGQVYKHIEPAAGTPQFKTFLLADLSGLTDGTGHLDAQRLKGAGWVPAK